MKKRYTICFMSTGGLEIEAESEDEAIRLFDTAEMQRIALENLDQNGIEITEIFEEEC